MSQILCVSSLHSHPSDLWVTKPPEHRQYCLKDGIQIFKSCPSKQVNPEWNVNTGTTWRSWAFLFLHGWVENGAIQAGSFLYARSKQDMFSSEAHDSGRIQLLRFVCRTNQSCSTATPFNIEICPKAFELWKSLHSFQISPGTSRVEIANFLSSLEHGLVLSRTSFA